MRKLTTLLAIVFLSLSAMLLADDARYVIIPGYNVNNPNGEMTDYNDTIFSIINADSIGRINNPNTVYVLQRDCLYPLGKQIKNYDYHLQLVGEAGDGLLPEILPGPKSDGSYGLDFIRAYNDLTLRNIYFNGATPTSYQHWMIEMYGNSKGNTYTLDNVAIVYDRAAAICLRGDSLTLNVSNSVFGNTGANNAVNGNGRMIDIRPEAPYVKSITVENCITFNNSDRILRHMAGEIGYLSINHLTALNSLGMNGALQMGEVREAHITNNIFANTLCLGASDSRNAEQLQPDGEFAVITLDSNYVSQGQIVEVKNNNIYWDDNIINQAWALYQSVKQPNFICSTVEAALGANANNAYFSEKLVFGQVSDINSLSYWVASYYANPDAEISHDTWSIPGSEGNGGLYYDEFDVSYSASSKSATAGTDGGAIGCAPLDFSRGLSLGIHDAKITDSSFEVVVSPNPLSTEASLVFNLRKNAKVTLSIYSLDGRLVCQQAEQQMNTGANVIMIDATDIVGGIYMYHMQIGNDVATGKLVIQ